MLSITIYVGAAVCFHRQYKKDLGEFPTCPGHDAMSIIASWHNFFWIENIQTPNTAFQTEKYCIATWDIFFQYGNKRKEHSIFIYKHGFNFLEPWMWRQISYNKILTKIVLWDAAIINECLRIHRYQLLVNILFVLLFHFNMIFFFDL